MLVIKERIEGEEEFLTSYSNFNYIRLRKSSMHFLVALLRKLRSLTEKNASCRPAKKEAYRRIIGILGLTGVNH